MASRGGVLLFILLVLLFVPVPAQGGEVTSGIAEVNGTKLYYEVVGEGQPLVLVHAGSFDRRIWDEQFTAFADHYKVIRYDVRGHGKSALPTKPYSDTEDLYRLLQWLHVEKAHLVGLSLGGRIIIDFTLAHPEMVGTLILKAGSRSSHRSSRTMGHSRENFGYRVPI
jgi:pimeloyl-ACP methyl ester carboxylesterase